MKVFIGTMSKVKTEPKPRFVPVIPHVAIVPHIEPEPIAQEQVDTIVLAHIYTDLEVEPIQLETIPPRIAKKENRKIRPVSFSLADPLEARMNKFSAKQPSFSTYVKKLIQRDMEANK